MFSIHRAVGDVHSRWCQKRHAVVCSLFSRESRSEGIRNVGRSIERYNSKSVFMSFAFMLPSPPPFDSLATLLPTSAAACRCR